MGPWQKRFLSELEFVKNFRQLRDMAERVLKDVDEDAVLQQKKIEKLTAERNALQARLDFKED